METVLSQSAPCPRCVVTDHGSRRGGALRTVKRAREARRNVAIECQIVPSFVGPKSQQERDDRRLALSRMRGREDRPWANPSGCWARGLGFVDEGNPGIAPNPPPNHPVSLRQSPEFTDMLDWLVPSGRLSCPLRDRALPRGSLSLFRDAQIREDFRYDFRFNAASVSGNHRCGRRHGGIG